MDVGGAAADVVVKEGVELTGEALKLAGAGIKNVAALLLAIKHEHYKLVGKTNAKTLAKDPSPAVVAPLKIEDKGKFQKLARSFGLLYFIPRRKGISAPRSMWCPMRPTLLSSMRFSKPWATPSLPGRTRRNPQKKPPPALHKSDPRPGAGVARNRRWKDRRISRP